MNGGIMRTSMASQESTTDYFSFPESTFQGSLGITALCFVRNNCSAYRKFRKAGCFAVKAIESIESRILREVWLFWFLTFQIGVGPRIGEYTRSNWKALHFCLFTF